MKVILNNYQYIMSTLHFIKINNSCAKAKELWTYFASMKTLYLVNVGVAFTGQCQSLVSYLSIDMVDIISCFDALRRFRQMTLSYGNDLYSSEDVYISKLRQDMRFYTSDTGVARARWKNLRWDVRQETVVNQVNSIGTKIKDSVIFQLNVYVKVTDIKFYSSIQQCLDPAEYRIYRNLTETQNHGRDSTVCIHVLNNRNSNGQELVIIMIINVFILNGFSKIIIFN